MRHRLVVDLTAPASAVAKLATTLALQLDLSVVNLVRRSPCPAELASQHPGVGRVSTDDDNWQERVRAATGRRTIRAVLDPVGGETASEMLQRLASRGTFVSYGDSSGKPIATCALGFSVRDIRIHGVSVGRWAQAHSSWVLGIGKDFTKHPSSLIRRADGAFRNPSRRRNTLLQ
jgi:NADPH:quinone reductase-like Zn-dependent oxidoreductase